MQAAMEAGRSTSAYNRGMKGYRTPNIDHIANEGANFTDYFGQRSCTAGRPAFITGPSPDTHWASQNRPAGREGRVVGQGPEARRAVHAAGLRLALIRRIKFWCVC